MRRILLFILLFVALMGGAFFSPWLMIRNAGDARLASEIDVAWTNGPSPGLLVFDLPDDKNYDEFTVTAWARLQSSNPAEIKVLYETTTAFICPEPLQLSGPDLLAGGCGFDVDGGTNFSGTAIFSVLLDGYDPDIPQWPDGVYTVAGWSSNQVTVSVGGQSVVLEPGEFNRNVIAGAADLIAVTASGVCSVGVAKCHLHKFHVFIDGVADLDEQKLTADSIITNEIKFVNYRFRIDNGWIIYNSGMADMDLCNLIGITQSNKVATGVSQFSGAGSYRLGLNGLGMPSGLVRVEWFDVRFLPWRLTDAELCRVHSNGAEEISRRGIQRWQ